MGRCLPAGRYDLADGGFARVPGDPLPTLRHALTHLVSVHWGDYEPPFKGAGLATWVQGTVNGQSPDFLALVSLLAEPPVRLAACISRQAFHKAAARNFALAGSFTGFVMRRFGRHTYRRWYARAGQRYFKYSFWRCFGISLDQAEQMWREDLLARQSDFEPELTRAVRKRRAMRALNEGRIEEGLKEGLAAVEDGIKDPDLLLCLSETQLSLGNDAEVLRLTLELCHHDDPFTLSCRAAVFLGAAQCCDRLGQRQEAITYYEQALRQPDLPFGQWGSVHCLARRFLPEPDSEPSRDLP